MANVPLLSNQKAQYKLTVADKNGNNVSLRPGDTISITSSNPAAATVVPDATPVDGTVASGFIVGVEGGTEQLNLQLVATITPADATPPYSVTDILDVTEASEEGVTAFLSLAAPVAQ